MMFIESLKYWKQSRCKLYITCTVHCSTETTRTLFGVQRVQEL